MIENGPTGRDKGGIATMLQWWFSGEERNGGEGGIRTRGTAKPHNGFRGRRLQPLGHLSALSEIGMIAYSI